MTQQRGHSLERKKEQADTELSASAGSAVQRASSDAVAILFFLRNETKRMGRNPFGAPERKCRLVPNKKYVFIMRLSRNYEMQFCNRAAGIE